MDVEVTIKKLHMCAIIIPFQPPHHALQAPSTSSSPSPSTQNELHDTRCMLLTVYTTCYDKATTQTYQRYLQDYFYCCIQIQIFMVNPTCFSSGVAIIHIKVLILGT